MIDRHGIKAFLLWVLVLVSFAHSAAAKEHIHIVAKGETIFSISRLYKVSQDDLMRNNGIEDASKLKIGARLSIPGEETGAVESPHIAVLPAENTAAAISNAASSAFFDYTVSKNDTLYSIARTYNVTLQALRDINGFSKSYVLKAGEKIKIPGSSASIAVPAATPVAVPTVITTPAVPATPATTAPRPPVRAASRPVDPSVRWPIAAAAIMYLNNNTGVLVSGKESESIKSLSGGIVVYASPWRGYGNVAVVETEGGYRYLYGSCETLSVKKGDRIEPGTELGKLGIYSVSGKPDLVFMVSHNGSPIDPAKAPRF